MKRFLTLVCMIACVFGLTACGETDTAKQEYENQLLAQAQDKAIFQIIPFLTTEGMKETVDVLSAEELEYTVASYLEFEVEGNALKTAFDSFDKGRTSVGEIVNVKEVNASVEKNSILVNVDVEGSVKEGTIEIVFSKDMFLVLESASISPKYSVGEMMGKAGLNTLLGMGTVFIVLILICFIISGFSIIGKIQKKLQDKKTTNTTGIDNAVAQIVVQEEETTDDLELVAVIAAAVAAYEGAASSDGYVVRSIRKVNR